MDLTQVVVVAGVVLAVLAFVAWPALRRQQEPARAHAIDPARIEGRITEYRAALRRGTVCERCLFPNREGSRFCAECGARLPAAGPA